jgi:DNA-directed RNA polymerase subunit M/transcription elongation factor TFIIS
MKEIVFFSIISILPSLVSSLSVYFIMKRKRKADAQGTELDNVEKAVSIWRELSQGLEEKLKDLQEQMDTLRVEQKKKCEECKYRKHYYARNQNQS